MKFFVHLKPIALLSNNEPPGYSEAAISIKITEMIKHIKTEYFLVICQRVCFLVVICGLGF